MFSGVLAVRAGPCGFFHNVPCSEIFNPPEDRVATGNVSVSINIEFSMKDPLFCRDRLTTSNKAVVSEQIMLQRPLLHCDWIGIPLEGERPLTPLLTFNRLPCTTYSKNTRLPSVILYYESLYDYYELVFWNPNL